jgi:hypothetical protein
MWSALLAAPSFSDKKDLQFIGLILCGISLRHLSPLPRQKSLTEKALFCKYHTNVTRTDRINIS